MMRGRRRSGGLHVNGEINVVSLIDVMMLLMVIFMIAAPIMQGGVDISLPRADVRPLDAKSNLVVTIKSNGRIYVDDVVLTERELAGSVKALASKKGSSGVTIFADQSVDYGLVYRVMGMISKAGMPIGLAGEQEPSR